MAIDSAQKRMSAISPACPWRGPMVDSTESGFGVGNRGAAAFLYSGVLAESSGSTAAIGFFPHRHFTLRYFPDRYFPGTGGIGGLTWWVVAGEVFVAGDGGMAEVYVAGAGENGEVFVAGCDHGAGELVPR